MISQGDICWGDLGPVSGSRPGKCRPLLVVQADGYNASKLATVIVLLITSNTDLASMPGNVFLPAAVSSLPRDSVVNVTAIATISKAELDYPVGSVHDSLMYEVERGMRRVLAL